MLGYGKADQQTDGIHLRLRDRDAENDTVVGGSTSPGRR
jgi:hypothetical protein